MRALQVLSAIVLLSLAPPALAQLRNRSISIESGISAPLSVPAHANPALALTATAWLDGSAEAVFRVGLGAAPETAGRAAAAVVSGTAGLRVSLLPEPLRPQLGVELGWARVRGTEGAADRLALGATAGLEWFPARDLSVTARAALRGAGPALSFELVLALTAYF